jgi:hypothetical protein
MVFKLICNLSFIQRTLTIFGVEMEMGQIFQILNCQVGQEGEYEVFGTYRITIQMGFHQVVIPRYTPIYPTWAPHCYALLVTIFLLVMFSYDYQ